MPMIFVLAEIFIFLFSMMVLVISFLVVGYILIIAIKDPYKILLLAAQLLSSWKLVPRYNDLEAFSTFEEEDKDKEGGQGQMRRR